MLLTIEALEWDNVIIECDGPALDPQIIGEWFDYWFDPDDHRTDPETDICDVIHSVLVEGSTISVDLGTANQYAFWTLLESLQRAGVPALRITSSRSDGPG